MSRLAYLALAVLATTPSGVALAHEGAPPAPHDLWTAWTLEPAALIGLAVAIWAYGRGVRAVWQRAGMGHGVSMGQVATFAAGVGVVGLALMSPVHALGSALFSAHMAQHLLLIVVAAPLLVLGASPAALLWALPRTWRRPVAARVHSGPVRAAWGLLTLLPIAWLLHVGATWAWHLPQLYEVALRDERAHAAEHATLLGTALLFWWSALRPLRRARPGYGAEPLWLFGMAAQGAGLGALIAFARAPWYASYSATTAAWGLTPLEDQQVAGLAMLMVPGLVYAAAALGLLAAWIRRDEQRTVPLTPHPARGDAPS